MAERPCGRHREFWSTASVTQPTLPFLCFLMNLLLTSWCTSKRLVLFSSSADHFFPFLHWSFIPCHTLEITVLISRNFFCPFYCFLRCLALKTFKKCFVPNHAWVPRAWLLLYWQTAAPSGLFSGHCYSCWQLVCSIFGLIWSISHKLFSVFISLFIQALNDKAFLTIIIYI